MNASPANPIESAPGILFEGIEGYAPVQVEGSIDGKRFDFRARFSAVADIELDLTGVVVIKDAVNGKHHF